MVVGRFVRENRAICCAALEDLYFTHDGFSILSTTERLVLLDIEANLVTFSKYRTKFRGVAKQLKNAR